MKRRGSTASSKAKLAAVKSARPKVDTLLLLSLSCSEFCSSSYALSCKLLQIRKLKTMAKCVKAKGEERNRRE